MKPQIIIPVGVGESSELCNSFVLVTKPNGKVQLCLDPEKLIHALNKPEHRGPTVKDILPRLLPVKYLTLIDANSGYNDLKLDEKNVITHHICMSI